MPRTSRQLFAALALVAAIAALPAAARQQPGAAAAVVAFTHVNVVPLDRERVLSNHTVVVRGPHIAAVGPSTSVRVPTGAVTIDGHGRYLMPGLAEMHGHILAPQTQAGVSQEALNERILELNVLRGITTIRGMLGHAAHLTLRDRLARNELLGPALWTSGPSFNGNSAPDAATAVRMVQEQKTAGFDFLKIHPGVKLDVFTALADAAEKAGITYQGHVPADVGLARALAAPYRAIDHLDGYIEAMAGWSPGPDAPNAGLFGFHLALKADSSKMPALVESTRKAGVWIVPTQVVLHTLFSTEAPGTTIARPEMQHVPKTMRDQWVTQKANFNKDHGLGTPELHERFFTLRRTLIRSLHAGGVKLLLGADSPQVMSVPGVAPHRELAYLVEAGLTPYQALETGTRNVAEFFGAKDRGTVAAEKVADLILVDANPLTDVANASKIAGVMVRGRWLSGDEITKRLAALATP